MASARCIRIPVDNDHDIETSVIPDVAKRMAAEGLDTRSQAAVIRWGLRDAANPRRRATTNAGIQNDVARSMIDELRSELESALSRSTELDARLGMVLLETGLAIERRDAAEAKLRDVAPVAANVDGARLKAAREAARLSQQDLATALGYKDRSAVSLAERGRAPLSASMAKWLKEHWR